MSILNKLFENKIKEDEVEDMTKEHINVCFCNPGWGHACSIMHRYNGEYYVSISGHSMVHFDVGDYIVLKSASGNPFGFRYKVVDIEWMSDPRDMFFADCIFANTQSKEDIELDSKMIKENKCHWKTATPVSTKDIIDILQTVAGVKIELKKK